MMLVPDTRRMRVVKYIPDQLYGFVEDERGEAFFHLGVFHPGDAKAAHKRCRACPHRGCTWDQLPPPPILGEMTDTQVGDSPVDPKQAPRAIKVLRVCSPVAVEGIVETFDGQRGYGFLRGEDGESYHLHRSELLEGRLPLQGQRALFFAGTRQGRPRACHVRICP